MKHPELWPELYVSSEYQYYLQSLRICVVHWGRGGKQVVLLAMDLPDQWLGSAKGYHNVSEYVSPMRRSYLVATKKKDTVPTLTDWWGELAGIGENNEGAEGPLFDEATQSLAAELARRAGKDPEDLDMLNLPIGDGGAPVKVQIPIWMAFVDQARQISDKIAGRG